jgi:hypothetical protein
LIRWIGSTTAGNRRAAGNRREHPAAWIVVAHRGRRRIDGEFVLMTRPFRWQRRFKRIGVLVAPLL